MRRDHGIWDCKMCIRDSHYSDFWADPGQQRKPKDWDNLSFKELKEAVFSYTRDTLTALKEDDVLPDIVQIGNEIRSGLLFPDGELPDYTKMVQLVNAGIRGARAAAGKDEMQVMIHLDQGGRYFYLKEWFDCSFEAGLEDFDLIGLSYLSLIHISIIQNGCSLLPPDFSLEAYKTVFKDPMVVFRAYGTTIGRCV